MGAFSKSIQKRLAAQKIVATSKEHAPWNPANTLDELFLCLNMVAAFRCGQRYVLFKAPIRERVIMGEIMMREPFSNFWGEPDPNETVERPNIQVIGGING